MVVRTKLILLTAMIVMASPASANINIGSINYGYEAPKGSDLLTFDDPNQTAFKVTGGSIRNFTDENGAEPAIGLGVRDKTNYLAVTPNSDAIISSDRGYRTVSLLWGSMDSYNTISLIDKAGHAFASYSADKISMPANGNQSDGATNRRVTFNTSGTTPSIYGLRLSSAGPAFEADNVSFAAPVPEPSVWASMLLGLGGAGFAAKRRKKGSQKQVLLQM